MVRDTSKIIQALAYLANYQPNKALDNMKAYKLLWLADRYHLRQTGTTITGDSYYAMPFGIVPSDAKCLLENEKTKMKESKRYKNKYLLLDTKNHQYKTIAEPDLQVFSDSDQEALDKVLAAYNKYDARQLSTLSHSFPEWRYYQNLLEDKKTKNSYKIDFDYFFENTSQEVDSFFNESKELLALTKELYHQYNRN